MSRLLGNPKALAAVIVLGTLSLLGLAGGALGERFGGGFIGSPLAHIQLPAESITSGPIIGDFKITNTMVASWIAIVVLGLVSFLGTRRLKEVPGRLQNALEVVLEFFLNLAESVAGPERGRRFFPLALTIFLFVATSNWLGILPGFGTIGRFEPAHEVIEHAEEAVKEGEHADLSKIRLQVFEGDGSVVILPFGSVNSVITAEEFEETGVGEGERAGLLVPFLRSANTDINTTLAIALVAMVMVHWWGLRALGVLGHIGKFVNLRAGPIGLFVGILEGIGEVARVISFTFRLFGNIFAGEVLLIAMAFLFPLVGLVPFLGLELFVGLIQAFIFAMLTLVFAATATVGHGASGHQGAASREP
jgi:F-type H+-transporting ATPase subunit a